MKKPITFKTALWIVLGLHILVYVGVVQISSLRYKLAKTKWNEKMQHLATKSAEASKDFWPTTDKKRVVTKPPIQNPPSQNQVQPIQTRPLIAIKSPTVKEPIVFRPIEVRSGPSKQQASSYPMSDVSVMKLVLIGFLALIIALFFFPLCTIWSLNTLFGLKIAYTFWNWLAVVILIITIQGAVNVSRK